MGTGWPAIRCRSPNGAEGMPDVIVPRKAVAELRKLLEEALDGNVQIDLSASKVRFTWAGRAAWC